MNRLTFKEVVSCTNGITYYTGEDIHISGVEFDSRGNVNGAAFVAFVTDKNNGHNYVSVAASKGARFAIVSEEVETTIPTIKVEDTKKAFQDIAAYYRQKFTVPVIAITGSNGKTTVKDMLASILSAKYKVLATEKNLNNELGVPKTLLKLDGSYDIAVIEMGMDHHGEIQLLSEIAKPDVAIITKIGTAHVGNLGGTREDVFHAKMEIVSGLKKGGLLVLCGDDDLLSSVASDEHPIVFSGLNNDGRNVVYADDITQYWDENGYGITFLVHCGGDSYSCSLPILGKHNVQNAILALTVGLQMGVPIIDAINALRIYPRSSMRLETAVVAGVKFIKDYYNASPDSTKSALDTLAEIKTNGSHIAILGELLDLGEQSEGLHRELAKETVGRADVVYYVGNHIQAFLSARADANCYANKDDLNYALSSAIQNGNIADGDVVLIKGSNGMKMWEQYEFVRRSLERGSIVSTQTRLLIDVDALKNNYSAVKQYVGNDVMVMPVIKADAYGGGADVVANVYGDCKYFAVADLREADVLHTVMPNAKFLVLYQSFAEKIEWMAAHDYVVSAVGTADFVQKLDIAAVRLNKKLAVHINVDTGMSRLGVLAENCGEFCEIVANCGNLCVEGIFTHYSSADMYAPEDLAFTAKQTARFKEAVAAAESVLGNIPYKHACAGAAIFNPQAEHFNMVRPGYILYGYYPCEEIKGKVRLKPAMKYLTAITQIKEYDECVDVSYGRHFSTTRRSRLAAVPVGYYDGLPRKLSNKGAFVINGQLAPIVGMITMNYTMVDVTDIDPPVQAGDEVYIFDNVNMTIERMAELCGTIGYEILTNIKKVDRIEIF